MPKLKLSRQEALQLAMQGDEDWIKLGPFFSYGSESTRVEVFVAEGSPAQAFVIVSGKNVWKYNGTGKRIGSYAFT